MSYKSTLPIILVLTLSWVSSCTSDTEDSTATDNQPPIILTCSIVRFLPHDSTLYTEGFLIHNDQLFESTGSPDDLPQTNSAIGITDLTTGKFDLKIKLDKTKYFGEGIVFLKNKLYQLTYKNQVGFIYDEKSFKKIDSFKFSNKEGWSLTTDGNDLIMSDGTDALTFLNPNTLKPVRVLKVTENGMPRDSINELEYIKGFIYANIWINNSIIKIDPSSGKVLGKIDLAILTYDARSKNRKADVLNGIAYDSIRDKIYVTGKMWANIYEINFPH